jgi:hypothetical protein
VVVQTEGDVPATRVLLPAYSPELNLAKRVFQEVSRQTEGGVYDSLSAKQAIAACAATPATGRLTMDILHAVMVQ